MSRLLAAIAIALPIIASPAAATTWAFGGANGTLASLTKTVAGEATLTVVARGFTVAPSTLTNISQLATLRTIDRIASSIGVVGGANTQLDTNATGGQPREAFIIMSDRLLSLTGIKLSVVDLNDTVQIYGVGAGGALVSLGFGGTIAGGLGGLASAVNTGTITANVGGTSALTFNTPLARFQQYVLTTRAGGDVLFNGDLGQGYRLDTISAAVVPEPASWALLIAGFGLVGAMQRRRRTAVSATVA